MVYEVKDQDPNEIEWFEFTLPGDYEQKKVKGQPVWEKDGEQNDTDVPVLDPTKPKLHRVPTMQYLGVDLVTKMEDEGLGGVLAAFGGDASGIRKLNGKQLNGLMTAWREASRSDLGESSGSQSSSNATASP